MHLRDNKRVHVWTNRRISLRDEQMRILVVDDHAVAAEALAAALSLENTVCLTAFGGVEAISTARTWLPHAIVMDISMPECTGFEAALTLRRDHTTSCTAIIAFTALDETEVQRHLVDQEFDGYCQKGQSPSALIALLMGMVLGDNAHLIDGNLTSIVIPSRISAVP